MIGPAAYEIALPPHLANLDNVFHVSQVRKYIAINFIFLLLMLTLDGIGRGKGTPNLNQQPRVAITTIHNEK